MSKASQIFIFCLALFLRTENRIKIKKFQIRAFTLQKSFLAKVHIYGVDFKPEC